MEQIMDKASGIKTSLEEFIELRTIYWLFLRIYFISKYINESRLDKNKALSATYAEFICIKKIFPDIPLNDDIERAIKELTNYTVQFAKKHPEEATKIGEEMPTSPEEISLSMSDENIIARFKALREEVDQARSENPIPDSSIKINTERDKDNRTFRHNGHPYCNIL